MGEIPDLSNATPSVEDALRAEMWQRAKAISADIWTHLTDEQRAMIEARIEWALPGAGR